MPITVRIDSDAGWDEIKEEFTPPVHKTLVMEHSLVSVHKWEAKYKKPFLTSSKSEEEILFYLECMTITQNVDFTILNYISHSELKRIMEYINDPMSATTVKQKNSKQSRDIQTAETIYGMMIALNIPFECRKWHFNQLMKLIEVCAANNGDREKMSKKDIYAQNKALNEARRAKHKSKG